MGSSEENVILCENKSMFRSAETETDGKVSDTIVTVSCLDQTADEADTFKELDISSEAALNVTSEQTASDGNTSKDGDLSALNSTNDQTVSDANTSKECDVSGAVSKKSKKKSRHGKKSQGLAKESADRSTVRRVHYNATAKFKQGRKRAQSFPSISKFFLPHKRPRKDVFIPPTKFLLGGNISDPLNLNSLQDEDVNRAMNAVTPESSPLPTPPRHKAKIDVIIPPNIRDPLNLMEPLDNEEYEKRLEMQQRKPRKKARLRRRTTDNSTISSPPPDVAEEKDEGIKEPLPPEPSTSKSARKRSCSDSDNTSQKGKDCKKLRRMDSLDKIVSPVVPQPGAWMRARPQTRTALPERPASPHRTKQSTEGEQKLPTFHPKNSKYQYGNYDRYYGYRNLNATMDVRLQVFEMHRHLFQNKDVLDIGCNVGHISIAVAKTLGARSVVGIDIDSNLIGRARKNLLSFVPVPAETPKTDDDKKSEMELEGDKKQCDEKCKEEKCDECQDEHKDESKPPEGDEKRLHGRKIKRPKKNRKAVQGQTFFPMSMAMLYGPLVDPAADTLPPTFPYNVTFKQGNYVPREDVAIGSAEIPQFDLILCLSTTKWLHLNWGDAGLKRAFRKMFADLRPGGKLVLEAQNWASYKKKKRLTPTIYENFNSIELFPNKFRDYLLSPEVGFSKCAYLGVPQHTSKGFRRPIQLYIKGDFTPSKASWSDAYAPSSHHRPEAEPPRRTVYAPVAPACAYRPSDDAPSCGAATPYSPNLDCCLDDSPFYNPRSDTYAPSYQPPRPTVYATLPSPLGSASPAASPAASPSPAPHAASPAPHADPPHPPHMSARTPRIHDE